MSSIIKIASAQYPILRHRHFNEWREHVTTWVQNAAAQNAQLLIFPEYSSLDLTGWQNENDLKNASSMIEAMQSMLPAYIDFFSSLAKQHQVTINAGSFPVREGTLLTNRSYIFGADGSMGQQDKIMLTRFERERTTLHAGQEFNLFTTSFGVVAIAVCYDIQFPLNIRKIAEAGAQLIIVPACTGRLAGFNRVKTGCQARALENQIPVIHSTTVGDALWNPIADTNAGAAGCYTPADNGFPDDGILAIGTLNQPAWVYATLDLTAFETIRQNGHVLNWHYWPEQNETVKLPLHHNKI
jgi:predicted amidohydrolase